MCRTRRATGSMSTTRCWAMARPCSSSMGRPHLPDLRCGRTFRRHRTAGERRGHRLPDPQRWGAPLRGRPRLLRPRCRCPAGDPRLLHDGL